MCNVRDCHQQKFFEGGCQRAFGTGRTPLALCDVPERDQTGAHVVVVSAPSKQVSLSTHGVFRADFSSLGTLCPSVLRLSREILNFEASPLANLLSEVAESSFSLPPPHQPPLSLHKPQKHIAAERYCVTLLTTGHRLQPRRTTLKATTWRGCRRRW